MPELHHYRTQIDTIDAQIIALIAERFEVVKKVGEYKKLHNIAPLQPKRWQEVISSKRKLAEEQGIDPDFIENIWNAIHDEAIKLEE